MKFYHFRQNNSGGGFVIDDKLCISLYIEAENEGEANDIAEEMGVYFNGVDRGIDCGCCGDRWYEGDEAGNIDSVRREIPLYAKYHSRRDGPLYRIFFHDGTVEEGPSKDA